jgi:hypothetical protein
MWVATVESFRVVDVEFDVGSPRENAQSGNRKSRA